MADYDIVLNPEDSVFQELLSCYRDLKWSVFDDFWVEMQKSYKPEHFQFYAVLTKDKKIPISSIITARFAPIDGSIDLVCIGYYYTIQSRRGSGLGQHLWKKALDRPEFKNVNFGLNAVEKMHKKYAEKYGFDKYLESQIHCYTRTFGDLKISNLESDDGLKIVDFNDVDYSKVIEYDAKVTGNQRRDAFLKPWMTSDKMLAAKVALDKDGNVVGFIGFGDMNTHVQVCPLFAVTPLVASTLLKIALTEVKSKVCNDSIFMTNEFEKNTQGMALFDRLTDKKTFSAKLFGQFTKFVPKIEINQVFCVTDLGVNVV